MPNIQDACGEATPPPLCSAVVFNESEDVPLHLDLFFILYWQHSAFCIACRPQQAGDQHLSFFLFRQTHWSWLCLCCTFPHSQRWQTELGVFTTVRQGSGYFFTYLKCFRVFDICCETHPACQVGDFVCLEVVRGG